MAQKGQSGEGRGVGIGVVGGGREGGMGLGWRGGCVRCG